MMPSREQQLLKTAHSALATRDMNRAIAACRTLNTEHPEFVNGWRLAAEIHVTLDKHEAAIIALDKVLQREPADVTAALRRINCLLALGRNGEAIDALRKIAAETNSTADVHDQLGRMLASVQLHDQALQHYEKASALDPGNASLLYNVATAQRFLGDMAAAEATLDEALAIDPYDFEAQAMRSSLRKQTARSNHVETLRGLLDDNRLAERGRPNICYALAKEYDDLDDVKRSFAYLDRGARLRRESMDYRVATDLDIMDAIRATFDADFFSDQHYGDDSQEPIFIVGMPRTGTTLVERILGSHTEIHAAGELDNFGREIMRQVGEAGDPRSLLRAQVVARSADVNFARLGRDYIASTRPETGHTRHFIDKLPFNYLYAGLIHLALPNAKIINLVRHPMATCYAVFKQFFRDAYPFSYDLDDLAQYYIAYRKLMAHWHDVLPGVIHTVAYEDVVDDVEREARRLVEYCGLEWEPHIVEFYRNPEASTTASAAQVRQPVYRSSVERWRDYRDHLAPLEERLVRAGIDVSQGGRAE